MRYTIYSALALATAIVLFASLPSAHADVFVLEDGRSIEGDIVKQDSETVTIKTKSGINVTLKRWEITRTVTSSKLKEEYKKKLAAIKKGDAQAHFELAKWCLKNGLKKEAKTQFEKTLKIDPLRREARCPQYVRC